MIDHAAIEERIVVYVLGGMDPIERAAFEAEFEEHRPGCEVCLGLYGGFAEVAARLALAARPIDPPAGLEDRIAALAGGRQLGRAVESPGRRWRRAAIGIAAALVLVAGSVAGTLLATRGDDRLRLAVMQGERGDFTLAYVPGHRDALIVGEAPAPPAGRTYELWLRIDGTMVPSGLFGPGATAIELPGTDFDLVAVTEEPAAGSDRPTSDPLASTPVGT